MQPKVSVNSMYMYIHLREMTPLQCLFWDIALQMQAVL